jgi:hypothetical protein
VAQPEPDVWAEQREEGLIVEHEAEVEGHRGKALRQRSYHRACDPQPLYATLVLDVTPRFPQTRPRQEKSGHADEYRGP